MKTKRILIGYLVWWWPRWPVRLAVRRSFHQNPACANLCAISINPTATFKFKLQIIYPLTTNMMAVCLQQTIRVVHLILHFHSNFPVCFNGHVGVADGPCCGKAQMTKVEVGFELQAPRS